MLNKNCSYISNDFQAKQEITSLFKSVSVYFNVFKCQVSLSSDEFPGDNLSTNNLKENFLLRRLVTLRR